MHRYNVCLINSVTEYQFFNFKTHSTSNLCNFQIEIISLYFLITPKRLAESILALLRPGSTAPFVIIGPSVNRLWSSMFGEMYKRRYSIFF